MSLASERDLVRVSPDPISQEEVTEFVTDPSIGAISLFIGELSVWSFFVTYKFNSTGFSTD